MLPLAGEATGEPIACRLRPSAWPFGVQSASQRRIEQLGVADGLGERGPKTVGNGIACRCRPGLLMVVICPGNAALLFPFAAVQGSSLDGGFRFTVRRFVLRSFVFYR